MNAETKPTSLSADSEPTATMTPVPVWFFALTLILLFLGSWYYDLFGGWFNAKVYAPYRSFAQLESFQPVSDPNASYLSAGKKLYSANCAVCHMETGVGNPANGCPPLIDSEWTSHVPPDRIVSLVSKGLAGPITVNGKVYNTGVMLAVGDSLPGEEAEKAYQIGAIISYVRKEFGGIQEVVTPDQTAAIRAGIKSRTTNFTPEELLKMP